MDNRVEKNDLKKDIAKTRKRIGQDINELGDKVSPENITETIAEGAKEALGQTQEAVTGTVESLTETISEQAQGIGAGLVDTIRQNPLPTVLMGLGIGLLAAGGAKVNQRNNSNSLREEKPTTNSSDIKALPEVGNSSYSSDSLQDRAYDVTEGTKKTVRQTKRGIAKFIDEQPLAAGGIAALLGLGVGLAFPSTRYEDEFLGEHSDQLINEIKGSASDAVSIAKESAKSAVSSLKESAKDLPNPIEDTKESLKDVAAKAQEAVSEAASSAKKTAKKTATKQTKTKTKTSRTNDANA